LLIVIVVKKSKALKKNKNIGGQKMTFSIEVENKFEAARRDIHVLRKSWEETLETHRVSCPVYGRGEEEKQAVALSLGTEPGQEDYLQISVDNDQVDLGPCKIDLPANVPFTFIPAGTGSITVIPQANGSTGTSLRIPPGPPAWKLEIKKPSGENVARITESDPSEPNVTVGDDGPGGQG
jgi:hypothetical protein